MPVVVAAAQDPGGARALAPVIRALQADRGIAVRVLSAGVATGIFASEGITCHAPGEAEAFLATVSSAHVILTGTASARGGHSPPLDQAAWIAARAAGVRTVAILDSWQNHRERFSRPGSSAFRAIPDRIAVMDEETAFELREAGIPAERVVVTGQPYFDRYAVAADPRQRGEGHPTVLFVGDPIGDQHVPDYHAGYWIKAPGIHTRNTVVVHHVIEILLRLRPGVTLVVRPHPKSGLDEFARFTDRARSLCIRVTSAGHPSEAIAESDVVIGLMALMLVEAYLAGRHVISVVPQQAEEGQLMLNRRGYIEPVRSVQQLETALAAGLSAVPPGFPRLGWLSDGRATERVVALVRQML